MKLVLNLIFIFLIFHSSFSQELVKNEKDEFTGSIVKQTSWEPLVRGVKTSIQCSFRFSKYNGEAYLDIKLIIGSGKVFSIDEGDELMIKLSDGSILSLENFEYQITCMACGAHGIVGSGYMGLQTSYPINSEQILKIINNDAIKIRFYTTDGYLEEDINLKRWKILQESAKLISDF